MYATTHSIRLVFLLLLALAGIAVAYAGVSEQRQGDCRENAVNEEKYLFQAWEVLSGWGSYREFRHAQPARASGPGPHVLRTTSGEQFGWRMELIREDGCICELEDALSDTGDGHGSLRFWPNPAGERVYVDLRDLSQDIETIRTLQVLDLQGRMMLEHRVAFDMEVLPVEQLSPGTYILRVQPEGKYGLTQIVH
jgi:hypothetical protein